MGEAYTAGLQVREVVVVRRRRVLPVPGEVLVRVGDMVTPETVVARANLVGLFQTINVIRDLGIPLGDVEEAIKKGWFKVKVGDAVREGDIIASRRYLFGRKKKESISPMSGTIEYISKVTGKVHIRGPPIPVELKAYIPGKVVEVLPSEGVVIETLATFIQGIFGIGGQTHGELSVVVDSPEEVLAEDKIVPDKHAGKILVGGSLVTGKALQKASKASVRGIIVGGVEDEDLTIFLGYEVGVAITGEEDIKPTLIITEGFGKMRMLKLTFDLLKKSEGKEASIDGKTHIRAGVIRPEIIIPLESEKDYTALKSETIVSRLELGSRVRIIRGRDFGVFGKVIGLMTTPKEIETESKTVIIEVLLEDGRRLIIPRANVEIIGG